MSDRRHILAEDEIGPVSVVNPSARGPVVIVCEHASHRLPRSLGTLGLQPDARTAHIAWDPGALGVALAMGEALDATVYHQNYSRLIYDCNRPPEAPDAMPAKSEIYDIPGNLDIDPVERAARVAEIYRPFAQGLEALLAGRRKEGRETVLVTMHSFTPVYRGKARSVEIGILHDADARLADRMLAIAPDLTGRICRRNDPYGPDDGVTHTLKEHGLKNGLMNVMIEVRNDLIADRAAELQMAASLSETIRRALAAIRQAA